MDEEALEGGRLLMTHYSMQLWQAYIHGDEFERDSMDNHLQECDACLGMYVLCLDELQTSLPQLTSPIDFVDGVQEQVQLLPVVNPKQSRTITPKRWYTHTWFHYTIAASLTFVLVSSGMFNHILDRVSQLSEDTEQAEHISVSNQLSNKAGKWLDAIPTKKKEGKP
jgi:predicted anti-sigma-YlaC factor YlaD